jgi:hypothetical protein
MPNTAAFISVKAMDGANATRVLLRVIDRSSGDENRFMSATPRKLTQS